MTPTACSTASPPASPLLKLILPRGVQRGSEYELTFSGERLQDAEEVFLYDSGVTVTGVEVVDNKNVKVKINVAADCRLGEHVAQLRTRSGISDFRSFYVGALPGVDEVEENNSLETAQVIEQNVTVAGVITNEDVDCFSIDAKKGQRLSVEIEAVRLGSVLDTFVAILDQDRFELAVSDDTPLLKQDSFLSVTIPADGRYTILVREASYRGDPQNRYRLHVGQFPRPSMLYPAGGAPGSIANVKVLGDPAGDIDHELQVPDQYGFRDGIFYEDDRGVTPSPLHFRLSGLTNVMEFEPNNVVEHLLKAEAKAAEEKTAAEAPVAEPPKPAEEKPAEERPAGKNPDAQRPDDATQVSATVPPASSRTADSSTAAKTNDHSVTGPHELPVAFNGIVSYEGDYDIFSFTATKDRVIDVECYARRIGSGLDAVIHILSAEKKYLAGNDDAKRPDAYIRFTAPADGRYYVRVFDHLKRGQSDFVYRVELAPVEPSLRIEIPRVDRYSQSRQTIAVPQGNRYATLINATRNDFGGELKLLTEGLPAGIKVTARPMPPGMTSMPVVFEADESAEVGGGLIELRAAKSDDSIHGSFFNLADFVRGNPNNSRYYGCEIDRLAMAVTEKVPFQLELIQPSVPVVKDGSAKLKVIVHRDEGFEGKVRVQFPFRSPGIGTQAQIEIPADKTEIDYPLNANGNAQTGKWPVYVTGRFDAGKGPVWVSSSMVELEVSEPFVRATIKRPVCVHKESAEVVCTLEQLIPFDGEATLEVVGLPAGATIETQKFTKDTTELKFNVMTTGETPVRVHKSIFCRVIITGDGQPIVSRTGFTELQVINPPVEEKPVEETPVDEKPQDASTEEASTDEASMQDAESKANDG